MFGITSRMFIIRAALFACIALCSGCASIGMRVVGSGGNYFSGVRGDALMIGDRKNIDPSSQVHPAIALLDMPFSLIADIVLLPRDAYLDHKWHHDSGGTFTQ